MSFTVYYASDVHGSDLLWRKFLNAGPFYGADVLVMGGDLTGKAVVPIIRTENGLRASMILGDRLAPEAELPEIERRVRDQGFYPYVTDEAEVAAAEGDPRAITAVFSRVMAETLERWLVLAEERLRGTGTQLYVMLGNDDEPALQAVLDNSPLEVSCEAGPVSLGEGIQMISCGVSNPTPWNSPREEAEDELEADLERLVATLDAPTRAVFNFHVPPKATSLDQAPEIDENFKPVLHAGGLSMIPAGSSAVRSVIERYQPLVALHGHIHESRGVARLGRTVCINPGSEYGEGILHGALLVLDRKKGLRNHQLVSG